MPMTRFLLYLLILMISGTVAVGREPAAIPWKESSVLSSGKWLKIRTAKKGIYKITYDKLRSWGFTSPELVNVYGNGGL